MIKKTIKQCKVWSILYKNFKLCCNFFATRQSVPQPDLDIWWRHPHLQNGAHAEKHEGRSDFRQWEIRGVKKKCRPMNVCAFLGGKTTEHEIFSAQRNARQGEKHRKKEGECHFLDLWKNCFWNLHKICLLIVVCLVQCKAVSHSAVKDAKVSCAVNVRVFLQSDGKAPWFFGKKMNTKILTEMMMVD